MKIKCTRSVLTENGVTEIDFYFDTETLDFEFNDKDIELLIDVYNEKAFDIPDLTEYSKAQ
jgi:hypothetical protein